MPKFTTNHTNPPNINRLILEHITSNLDTLSWQCTGCPRMDGCEKEDGKAKLYCREILLAAILDHREFAYRGKT